MAWLEGPSDTLSLHPPVVLTSGKERGGGRAVTY